MKTWDDIFEDFKTIDFSKDVYEEFRSFINHLRDNYHPPRSK